jgi:hypothetical protein
MAGWPAGQHEQAQGDLGATGEGVGLAPGQNVGGDVLAPAQVALNGALINAKVSGGPVGVGTKRQFVV